MANVAVLNMAGAQVGTIELNDAIFGIEANEHVMAVVENLTDRKVPAEQDRAPSVPLSGLAVALYSLPSPEIIPSS